MLSQLQTLAYGTHQEYDDNGNYQDPYYAMSTAMQPTQDGEADEDQGGEICTSCGYWFMTSAMHEPNKSWDPGTIVPYMR